MTSKEKADEFIRQIYDLSDDVALGAELRGYRNRLVTLIEEVQEKRRFACIESANDALSELNIRPSQKADVILAVATATGEKE